MSVQYVSAIVLPDGRLTRREAAKYLGRKVSTLADWHRVGKGPRSRLVGGRRFYDLADLQSFAAGGTAA